MQEYIYIFHPYRLELAFHPMPEEEPILNAHFAYQEQATRQGTVIIGGPSKDGSFGVVIFRADDDAAAQAFMENDPLVKGNLVEAELHPFIVSVRGGL